LQCLITAAQCSRRTLKIAGIVVLVKAALSIAIQLHPIPTPPIFRFLLNNRVRRRYRDPPATLARIGVEPGMHVLELGPGAGLFTDAAAHLLGDTDLLLCLDLQPTMLLPLQRLVRAAGLANVRLCAADASALPLAGGSIDLAYLIAVLPMLADKPRALAELRRILKPGGVLAVSEELLEPEYVPACVTERWCRRAGFSLQARYGSAWCYTLVFRAGG
jgi:ubiquinone/menaquinone biosynthesis C-methylase UbiE